MFVVIVKYSALTNDLEVRHEAALLKLRNSNHPNFENFLDDSRYSKGGNLYFPPMLHKMVEIVNVANLTRYCYSFCITGSNLSVVY